MKTFSNITQKVNTKFTEIIKDITTPKLLEGLKDWSEQKPKTAKFFLISFLLLYITTIIFPFIIGILDLFSHLFLVFEIVFLMIIFSMLIFIPNWGKYYNQNMDYYNENNLMDLVSNDNQTRGKNEISTMAAFFAAFQVFMEICNISFGPILSPLGDLTFKIFPMLHDINFHIPDLITISLGGWVKFILMIAQGIIYYVIAKKIKRYVFDQTLNWFNKPNFKKKALDIQFEGRKIILSDGHKIRYKRKFRKDLNKQQNAELLNKVKTFAGL